MNKEQLLARAQELNITVPEKATNENISDLIKIAEHPLLLSEISELKKNAIGDAERIKGLKGLETIANEKLEEALNLIQELESEIENSNAEKTKVFAEYTFGDNQKVGLTRDVFKFRGVKYTAKEAVENEELMLALRANESVHLKKL